MFYFRFLPKKLDYYILKVFLSYFSLCYITFIFLYFLVSVLTDRWFIQADFFVVLKYYAFALSPWLYLMILPTTLLSTLLCYSHLQKTSELTALHAVGMSPYRGLIGLCVSVMTLGVVFLIGSDQLTEKYYKKAVYIRNVEIKKKENFSITQTDKILYRSENNFFKINYFDTQQNTFYGFVLYQLSPQFVLEKSLSAEKCIFENGQWIALNGKKVIFVAGEKFPTQMNFDREILPLKELPEDFKISGSHQYDFYSIGELLKIIKSNKKLAAPTRYYSTLLQTKFSFLFAFLVMVTIAFLMTYVFTLKSSLFLNIFICIVFTIVFWFIHSTFVSFGNSGSLHPIIAAWASNVISVGVIIFIIIESQKKCPL